MARSRLDQRFFASTRGRLVTLLRRTSRTVDELAQALDLTDNAVRAHLSTLERDGLVQHEGMRRGASKPAYTYHLTPEAERLFPKPYGTVLRQLLEALADRMAPEELEAVLRVVGRRLAAGLPAPGGDMRTRLAAAAEALNTLGGLAELEEQADTLVIRGYRCPLAEAVPGHPAVCRLVEALLTELVGLPVEECCDRAEPPLCCFTAVGT